MNPTNELLALFCLLALDLVLSCIVGMQSARIRNLKRQLAGKAPEGKYRIPTFKVPHK
jgi:hypothetical protein